MKTACFIVPTGIGASIGGFAGDASCFARNMAKHVRHLIVNPNVVNAACFSGISPQMLYTEGFALDEFFLGKIALRPTQNNKIGVIFDKSIPKNILNIHINTINAVKTVYGADIIAYEITKEPVGIEFLEENSGISSGKINNPATLIEAGQKLKTQGAQAIGVVCLFDEPPEDGYAQGNGVDIVGGVEAIISHILTRELKLPCAHAPAFKDVAISTQIVDARAAAEYITPTFLPCILLGLQNAPQLVPIKNAIPTDITVDSLNALIMPYNSLGCVPVLEASKRNIPIIAVRENKTVLDITADKLGVKVIEVGTYEEAEKILIDLQI
ncbi:MAG: DUF3326 domain-containing protein [Candidatus Gastranaerophilales bacterium]|nr:DUF3326 domain-containing protein [Candidatus Gastranaerophilales bacterium]